MGCNLDETGTNPNQITDTIVKEVFKQLTYKELIQQLYEKEKELKQEFIDVKTNYWKNLWGNFVVEMNFTNNAYATIFKDMKVKIIFLSETNAKLDSTTITIYKYIKPQETIIYKEKFSDFPQQTAKVKVQILDYQVADMFKSPKFDQIDEIEIKD